MDFQYLNDYLDRIEKDGLSQRDIVSMESYIGDNFITKVYNLPQFTKLPSDRGIDKVKSLITSLEGWDEYVNFKFSKGKFEDGAIVRLDSLIKDLKELKSLNVVSLVSKIEDYVDGTIYINDRLCKIKDCYISDLRKSSEFNSRNIDSSYYSNLDFMNDFYTERENNYSWKLDFINGLILNDSAEVIVLEPVEYNTHSLKLKDIEIILANLNGIITSAEAIRRSFEEDYSKSLVKYGSMFEFKTKELEDNKIHEVIRFISSLKN